MASKKKKTKGKLHGAALAKWRRDHGITKAGHRKKPHTSGHRKPHHSGGAHTKTASKAHHKCGACGHTAKHDRERGCLHHAGGKFCDCRHRA